jgi:hypothetical protein
VLLLGCGKPTLEASCRHDVSVKCANMFECAKGLAEAQYGSQGNCVSQLNARCDSFRTNECDDLSAWETCINDTAARRCMLGTPPSCMNLSILSTCHAPSGRTLCATTNVNTFGNNCSLVMSECTDGRSYVISCQNGTCSCNDGQTSRSGVMASCTRESAVSGCGWNVEP